MTNAVIFDLDGLLIDSEIIAYKIYREMLRPCGHAFSVQEYAEGFSGKTETANLTNIIARYGLPLTVEQGRELVERREAELMADGVDLKPGAKELLGWLKERRYKVALATSSTPERALRILRQHGIEDCFDAFVFGSEVAHGKPAPDIFLRACEKIGGTPAESLVLEDSEAGIQAAHAAGIPVICIPDMKRPAPAYEALTARMLTSLHEVAGFLQTNGREGEL